MHFWGGGVRARNSHVPDISLGWFCVPPVLCHPTLHNRWRTSPAVNMDSIEQDMQQQQQGMGMIPDQDDLNGNYYPPENDLTGGLPINLDSLRDGPPGSKPFYPYSTLIRSVLCNDFDSGSLFLRCASDVVVLLAHLLNPPVATPSKALRIRNYYSKISTMQLSLVYVEWLSTFCVY